MLSIEEINNLIVFLDRVDCRGIKEAKVLTFLDLKLKDIHIRLSAEKKAADAAAEEAAQYGNDDKDPTSAG